MKIWSFISNLKIILPITFALIIFNNVILGVGEGVSTGVFVILMMTVLFASIRWILQKIWALFSDRYENNTWKEEFIIWLVIWCIIFNLINIAGIIIELFEL